MCVRSFPRDRKLPTPPGPRLRATILVNTRSKKQRPSRANLWGRRRSERLFARLARRRSEDFAVRLEHHQTLNVDAGKVRNAFLERILRQCAHVLGDEDHIEACILGICPRARPKQASPTALEQSRAPPCPKSPPVSDSVPPATEDFATPALTFADGEFERTMLIVTKRAPDAPAPGDALPNPFEKRKAKRPGSAASAPARLGDIQ